MVVEITDADRFSKETFLGQVVLPVTRFPTAAPRTEWLPLARRTGADRVRQRCEMDLHDARIQRIHTSKTMAPFQISRCSE